MTALLYTNPQCSTCRKAQALLEKHNIKFERKLYLDETLTEDEIVSLFDRYDGPIQDFARHKESKEFGLADNYTKEELASFLAKHPKALQRPIFIQNNRVIIARPPELILNTI
jgi:arsenate reductase